MYVCVCTFSTRSSNCCASSLSCELCKSSAYSYKVGIWYLSISSALSKTCVAALYIYVYICVCVCVFVDFQRLIENLRRSPAHICVCMCVYIYIHLHIYSKYLQIIHMFVHTYIHTCKAYLHICNNLISVCMCIRMSVCLSVCMYVCMYVEDNLLKSHRVGLHNIHTYTHTYRVFPHMCSNWPRLHNVGRSRGSDSNALW